MAHFPGISKPWLQRNDQKIQIKAMFLVIFRANMNTLFIIEVKIIISCKWSYRYPNIYNNSSNTLAALDSMLNLKTPSSVVPNYIDCLQVVPSPIVGLRGNYQKGACLLFIQHKSPRIVCKDPKLVYFKSFEMNQLQVLGQVVILDGWEVCSDPTIASPWSTHTTLIVVAQF